MNTFKSSNKRTQELNSKRFEIRKVAKLCICFVCLIQVLYRLAVIIWDNSLRPKSILMLQISLPLCVMMIVIISLEYFLFKKKGSGVVKYSNLIDLILLVVFAGDWIIFVLANLNEVGQMNPSSFRLQALLGFTTFSWRTLFVTLLVQKWQFKIIAPIVAIGFGIGFAVSSPQAGLGFLFSRAGIQLLSIILIVYCQDKVEWKLMRTNFEQEKWMQVNNFIFDNIPENIMILDLNGEAKFMSEYCKLFMKNFDIRDFFKKVQNLQQPDSLRVSTTTITTCDEFYLDLNESEADFFKVETLQDLISNFPKWIKSKNLQERQFLVYNGKFKVEPHDPEKSIEIKISFVHNYENDYIILIFRDTTQRDLLVKLEETNNYKDQLLASVSHELRAPLNGNINLIQGAIHSSEPPEIIKETLLIPALRSSQFLLHIINDIIDLSQIKQKKLRIIFQQEDLKETLKNTAQLVEIQATQKGLEFLVQIDDKISNDFYTDHLRVSQIVLNLLINAVKFTNQGTIRLIAKPFNSASSVQIIVEDSGIGISQEDIKGLFESNAITICEEKDKVSSGLGLNIASNLVGFLAPENQKHINVVSSPNKGSTFSFVLENKPLQQQSTLNLDRSSCESLTLEELAFVAQPKIFKKINTLTSSSSSSFEFESQPLANICSCPKVLIVDDNPFNTMALETILHSLKVNCDSVYGGSSAIQKLLSRQTKTCGDNCRSYSVIFMDQEMPGMSGEDTVKEIKRMQEQYRMSSGMRIIGCTALKAKEEVDRFLASGLESCIFKPVSISIIKNILKDI